MRFATTICGRSSEGRAANIRADISVRSDTSLVSCRVVGCGFHTIARASVVSRTKAQATAYSVRASTDTRSDLTSVRPFLSGSKRVESVHQGMRSISYCSAVTRLCGSTERLTMRSLAADYYSTPQTAPAGLTRPASLLLIAAAVVFPVECDLTTPRIRLTNPVTSPAASRRVVAGGETLNQRN
jgi:hypothetical protein